MNAQTKIEPQSLLGALAAALPALEAAKKNSTNPHFKSKYADLGAVLDAIQPIAEQGLWFRQVAHEAEGGVCIETLYIHDSGELSAGKVFVPADKSNAQGYGSAQTYARRYGLQLAFGLATEDDDGNAASAKETKRESQLVPLTADQWAKIVGLCQASRTQGDEVKKHIGAKNLKVLTPKQFNDAVKFLEDKLAEAVKAETDAKAGEPA